jgi:hypothetical protein
MSKKQFGSAVVACLLFLSTLVVAQQDKKPLTNQEMIKKMTNEDVVQMVTAGLSEQIITTSIRQAPAKDFDFTPTGLIALKKAGVTDTVILFMQEVDATLAHLEKPSADNVGWHIANWNTSMTYAQQNFSVPMSYGNLKAVHLEALVFEDRSGTLRFVGIRNGQLVMTIQRK